MLERTLRLSRPLSLRLTLSPLRHGRRDPCVRFDDAGFWRATRTPEGAATLLLRERGDEVIAKAWGPGAGWALDATPSLIGEHQEEAEFAPDHPVLRELHRRLRGLRIPRTGAVWEAMLPAILEQRVTSMEATRSYARIVRRFGERAPGPVVTAPLFLPPTPAQLADAPAWWFHKFGVEGKRAEALRIAARCAARLEEATALPADEARRRFLALPGIGPWTAAEVSLAALGDPDAVSVGDFHWPDWVAWALAGEPRADDRRMLELLEPYRGQRGRVIRLIAMGHEPPPKYGPRYSPIPIAAL